MAPSRTTLPTTARIGIGVGAGVVAILAVAYVGGHFLAADKLPTKASVAGVGVGGLTPSAAEQKLRAELTDRAAQKLAITAGTQTLSVAPSEAGLGVDYAASVAQSGGGGTWNPAAIITVLFGGSALPAVVAVDQVRLDATLAALAGKVDVPPVDAEVTYQAIRPVRSVGKDGLALDRLATAVAVKAAYLRSTAITATVATVQPEVTTAQADQAVTGIAATAVSGPVKVTVGSEGTIAVPPEAIAASLGFAPLAGGLVPTFDAAKLEARVAGSLNKLGLKQPRDATITISKGKPKIIASVDGHGVDPEQLGAALVPALSLSSGRTATVAVSPRSASFTSADAKKLGVTKVIGSFTTYFPGTAYRYNNIGKATRLINGTFLKPGEEFSMNKTLGKRTRAAGWMAGGAISGGKIVELLGGGISQATTTTFNAIYFAGLKDIYHKPHSLYFNRYPVGREATLDWDSVDMKFRNDSPYGVVMQASITGHTGTGGSVTVKVWSTKRYTIKASTPIRSNYRAPGKTIYDDSKGCLPQSAISGFDVRHYRLFYQGRKLVKKELFTWRYNSLTPVVCGKKPA
ncbi:MAG: VanW family protein [Propionicimonas sp.]